MRRPAPDRLGTGIQRRRTAPARTHGRGHRPAPRIRRLPPRQRLPHGRLAEPASLNTLGEALRRHGDISRALDHHRRGLEICQAGRLGLPPDLLALYQAITLRHLGRDYAALDQWHQAETPLRQALALFEESDAPALSGPTQLELGRALRHLDRRDEARTAVRAALHTLTTHHHPRQAEASAQLRTIDNSRH
ncbi:tetratricopeptide repeat protein [Streptomyces sp. NPDC090445]|uniref:tetratricopeptide repeat protein n=1 Tax=Streptomyces sp. NPDC090445 TaxID=3365963 RepID=UPI00382895A7